MAPIRWLACILGPALMIQGCSLFDPLIAADEYTVQAEGETKVKVKLSGGNAVGRLRQHDAIQDYMLDLSKDPDRVSAAFDAMLELEEIFEQRGYPLVQVDHEVARSAGRVDVHFKIDPGPRVTVGELSITGNKVFSAEELRTFWSRQRTDALGLGEDLYVASEIQATADTIRAHYRRQGYLDATTSLAPTSPPLAPDVHKVRIEITVHEGARYTIGEVVIDPRITAAIGEGAEPAPRIGEDLNPVAIRIHATSLGHHLRSRGYHKPVIRAGVAANEETHTVRITIAGDPGKRVRVRKIVIHGGGFVSKGRIRDRIELKEGAIFDGRLEEQSVTHLYRTGLFRKIEVTHESVDNDEPDAPGETGEPEEGEQSDEIDVVFRIEATTRYAIEPMIGWGSYERLRAGIEFQMLSVFDSDFDLNTKGTVSEKAHRVVVALANRQFWPSLFGYRTTLSLTADAFRREEPSFDDGAIGISPSLSHVFATHLSGRVAYIFREHSDTSSTVIHPSSAIGDYTEGSLVVEVAYDDRDNPAISTSGSRLSLQYKYFDDSLGGDVSFERVRGSLSTILPMTDSLRLVLRGESSILFADGGGSSIPIQEKLFNGGENTVRSFEEDQLAGPELRDVNGQVVGGSFRNIFNAEVRWAPPLQMMKSIRTELALFGDAGNIGAESNDYGLTDMKYAVGAGVRLLLPIGPIRFDAAYNPSVELAEEDWTFHFSIGYPF